MLVVPPTCPLDGVELPVNLVPHLAAPARHARDAALSLKHDWCTNACEVIPTLRNS